MKSVALCCIFLILVFGTASAAERIGRKLLQGGRGHNRDRDRQNTNLAANTVRAQAATSQSIQEAVDNGGSLGATRKAGQTGAVTAWATSQRQDVFDFVDRNSGPLNQPFGH